MTSIAGSLTACGVSFFYQYMKKDTMIMRLAVFFSILGGVLAFCTYSSEDIIVLETLRSMVGSTAGMFFVLPLVTQAASLSSDGSEGVSYAFFVSIMNLAGVVGEMSEGFMLRKINNTGLFIVVATIISWLPLLVI